MFEANPEMGSNEMEDVNQLANNLTEIKTFLSEGNCSTIEDK